MMKEKILKALKKLKKKTILKLYLLLILEAELLVIQMKTVIMI